MNKLITRRTDGTEVQAGDKITSFRGEEWIFVRATRPRDPGRSGKVLAQDPTRKNYHGTGPYEMEYYDGVFDLQVTEEG